MNFNDLSVKVSMMGFQVCCGKHGQQVLWYRRIQGRLLILNHHSLDIQEDDWFSFMLFRLCLLHQLIKVSLCPFLFSFLVKTYRFLLTFISVSLLSQQMNHRHQDSFNPACQVLRKIIYCQPFLSKNPLKVWVVITTQLALSISLEYHLKLDAFNQITLFQQSTIFINQYFQVLIPWFFTRFQDLLVSFKLLPKVSQVITFNQKCWVPSPQ